MEKPTPHELRDSLIADLVATSIEKTGEAKARDAEDFVVPILQEMDNKPQPELKKRAQAKGPIGEEAQAQIQKEARRQGIEGRVERFTPEPALAPGRVIDESFLLLQKRIRWMRNKPEYKARLDQACNCIMFGKRHIADHIMRELLAKSDEHLKHPWWKPEPKKLVFG